MSPANQAGRLLGGYRVEDELGRGGMGLVLKARQESLDRPVVLKRILAELAGDAEVEQRFEREAHTAARIHHPNVVAVYDRFRHRGADYIATEFVDGIDLAKLVERESPLPWRIAAAIGLEITRGLEAIHGEGTLHRDLKPQNILIGRRGQVKIADFGLAVDVSGSGLTQPGIAVGTPPYMPPEQLRGERVDARADLFALGCVLYEMLTGHTPFRAADENDAESLLARIEKGKMTRLRRLRRDVPRGLARLIERCLHAKARRRFGSARALHEALERFVGHGMEASGAVEGPLSAWLWERQVFEKRSNETVLLVAAPGRTSTGSERMRWLAAACAMSASVFVAAIAATRPDQILAWTDRVVAMARGLSG